MFGRAERLIAVTAGVLGLLACGRVGIRLTPDDSEGGGPLPTDDDASIPDLDGGSDPDIDAAICPTPCSNEHGSADCSSGVCETSCETGYQDCDGNPLNGCETDIAAQTTSCGACAQMCLNENGDTSCDAGTCAPACEVGFGDCDNDVRNGCETPLDTVENCGGCEQACSSQHATPSCNPDGGLCAPTCEPGYRSCDDDPRNGCETHLMQDPANCGGCGMACNSVQTCVNGSCIATMCGAGTANCDANDDCETNTTNNVASCGFCGNTCTFANANPQCTNASCGIASCRAGFGNCDNTAGNGCETTFATSLAHCGRCANPCTNAHGTTVCTGGACAPTCSVGWGSCDTNPQNGCETALNTVSNCGMCGRVCTNSVANATAQCNAGVCQSICNDLSGVYALKLTIPTTWPGSMYIRSGNGTQTQHVRLVLTQSGTTLSGTAAPCGRTVPDFYNSVNSDRYGVSFPDSIFAGSPPSGNISITLGGLTVGSTVNSTRTAAPLGISLADPVNTPWPSLSQAASSAVDHDGDGQRGITIAYRSGGGYTYPPNSASLFSPERATSGYIAERVAFTLGGTLTSCTQAGGGATVPDIDTHTIGCRTANGTCNGTEYAHLDTNAPNYQVGSTTYTMVRVGAAGATVSCASIRAAVP